MSIRVVTRVWSVSSLLAPSRPVNVETPPIHFVTQGAVSTITSPSPSPLPIQPQTDFQAILSEFSELLQPYCHDQPVKHQWCNTSHHNYWASNESRYGPDVFLLRDWRLLVKNLNTCCNRVSYDHLQAPGLHHFTWYLRKPVKTGVHVETTVLWTIKWQPLTVTQFLIYMTL